MSIKQGHYTTVAPSAIGQNRQSLNRSELVNQRVSMNPQLHLVSASDRKKQMPQTSFDDRRSSSSTINQFGSIKMERGKASGHKDYLKNMLVNRLLKKYPGCDNITKGTIEQEVQIFCANEYVTKESMKQLEQRVTRRL